MGTLLAGVLIWQLDIQVVPALVKNIFFGPEVDDKVLLDFPAEVPLGNILLTAWGPVIVALMR